MNSKYNIFVWNKLNSFGKSNKVESWIHINKIGYIWDIIITPPILNLCNNNNTLIRYNFMFVNTSACIIIDLDELSVRLINLFKDKFKINIDILLEWKSITNIVNWWELVFDISDIDSQTSLWLITSHVKGAIKETSAEIFY